MSKFSWLPMPVHAALVALRNRRRLRRQAHALAQLHRQPVKRIIVGAGPTGFAGWVPTDMSAINLLDETTWLRFMQPASLDAILAEHVWEHLTPEQAVAAARNCFKFLKPGGYLRVAVPDGFHPDPAYVAQVRPGGTGSGAHDHKVLYTHQSFERVFTAAGFKTRLYEYFDERGQFHFEPWDPTQGMIRRSKRFDARNTDGLAYTSVMLDAIRT